MTRRRTLAALLGALVAATVAAPAVASAEDPDYVCIRIISDPQSGAREGFCVWTPLPVRR